MASSQPNIAGDQDVFDKIAAQINDDFNKIVAQTLSRKNALLHELNELKLAFENNNQASIDNLKELEQMKNGLDQLALKQNFALKVLEDSVKDINLKIENLKAKCAKPDLTFQCNLVKVLENINNIGKIVKPGEFPKPRNASETDGELFIASRRKSSQTKTVIGKKGNGQGNFNCPQKLHIDAQLNFLYVADYYNNRIQIFNTNDWAFVCGFSTGQIYPNSIATNEDHCYVTSFSSNLILQYSLSNFQLIRSVDRTDGSYVKLDGPSHVAINRNNVVFVADWNNNRVCVFNQDLTYLRELGNETLRAPKHIAFSGEFVYVLDDNEKNCMHVFDATGFGIKSYLRKGVKRQITNPTSFCFNKLGNIVVADHSSDSVKVFSSDGVVSNATIASDEVNGYFCVALCGDKFVVSCRELNCVKIL